MKKGFYFQIGRKEFFAETNYKNKTKILAEKALLKLNREYNYNIPINPDTCKEVLYYMRPAFCEIKHCPENKEFNISAHDYYNIFGKNFSGYGSNDINDGNTIVFTID